MEPFQAVKRHVIRAYKERGFRVEEILGLPFPLAFWAKRGTRGGNFLMYVEIVSGRTPQPLTKTKRQALMEQAHNRGAGVVAVRIWLGPCGEIVREVRKSVR